MHMSNIQDTINDIADGLHRADLIDKKALRELTDDGSPLHEYTGEAICQLCQYQYG